MSRNFGKKSGQARRTATRERRAKVLLVVGGVRTETDYFNWVKKALATPGLHVELEGQGWNPARLFEHAQKLKQDDARRARKNKDEANVYDAVWVVTDVDEFVEDLVRITPQQSTTVVQIAISNPCFEAWLNMHYDSSAAPVNRYEAQRRSRELNLVDSRNPKRVDHSKLEGRFTNARSASRALAARHLGNSTSFPHDTPSTTVDEIVTYLIERAKSSSPGLVILL